MAVAVEEVAGGEVARVEEVAGAVKVVEVTGVVMGLSRFLAPYNQLPH